ncbi:MAG: hypothetical protein M1378_03155 [Bacteroidetes bacterium]|nr:hypothetical protein [Bacteroidota bacterium]
MTIVTEIAQDVYRISTYMSERNLQINQFLVRDDEPLLWHTGHKFLFQTVRDAVAKILDPAGVRWIGFSHFEADECGSLNGLAALNPKTLAVMHGSSFSGDCSRSLRELGTVIKDVVGRSDIG